jgi:hypothetical protein
MSLFHQLEQGILAPGLCLFGDNAYLNSTYMATPYAATSGGTKDDYNIYHSQLRIQIECAFGMLTHQWAILRSAKPMNVTVHKTVALVLELARLYNYCIDENEADCDVAYSSTATDEWRNEVSGAVPLVETPQQCNDNDARSGGITPRQLLHGGNHFDDVAVNGRYNRQRRYNYMSRSTGIPLPSERLHSHIVHTGLTRPTPHPSRQKQQLYNYYLYLTITLIVVASSYHVRLL